MEEIVRRIRVKVPLNVIKTSKLVQMKLIPSYINLFRAHTL